MALSRLINTNFVSEQISRSINLIKKDRQHYQDIYNIVEDYVRQNEIIISNKYALLDKEEEFKNIFDNKYKLYSIKPLIHANELVNLLHKTLEHPDKKFLRLKTLKEKEEFIIEYDMRIIVIMYKIERHNSVNYKDLINPISKNRLLYFPSEIELIDLYHNLYTNTEYDESEGYEKYLYEQVSRRKEKGILDKTGGNKEANNTKDIIEKIKVDIIKNIIYDNKDKYILLGHWAKDCLLNYNKINPNREKIQLISILSSKELLIELNKYIKNKYKLSVTMREQELHIPKDFRLNRYTYYINTETSDRPILDLFNCAEFEVIPYLNINHFCIAHKWVLLRSLFIDLWTIRLIKSLNLISDSVLLHKIKSIWELIEFFKSYKRVDTYEDIKFIGIYRDYNIDKKLNALNEKIFMPYYPEIYLNKLEKYRII